MRKARIKLLLILLFIIPFISFDNPNDRYFEIAKNMEILSSVYSEVNRYYVDDVDPNKLMKTGIDAMLKSLDPYTNYIPEDDIEDFRVISTGQYGGIGSTISTRDDRVLIMMPYKGFPADKAGLKIGDEIIEIDGKNVRGFPTSEISTLLKGQAGKDVTLKIKRYGKEDPLDFTLTREKIKLESVPHAGMVTDEVGYFKLKTFTKDASSDILNAMQSLKDQGAKKFIFDLRGNTGGLLKEAITISNFFVEKGAEIVSTKGKVEKWNDTHYAQKQAYDSKSPLVVLVDERSASASEIVSGVIQDYDRGILVGRQTYGKGLVQASMEIPYNAQVKITTAKYYIPSGRCIQSIDYSKDIKGLNGDSREIPDSLLVAYETKNGRKVYDGAGISPDIKVPEENYAPVLKQLMKKNYLFDYATAYYYDENESVDDPRTYEISDSHYDHFKNWLEEQSFEFSIPAEVSLHNLQAKLDSTYDNMNALPEISSLREKIENKKKDDLDEHSERIKSELATEIVAHFHLEEGVIKSSFDHDPVILKALEYLNDEEKYKAVLQP